MFQNLKKGSLVYVFDNREQPKFYTANVKDVSAPYIPPQKPGQFSPMQQFINISIEATSRGASHAWRTSFRKTALP